MTFANAVSGIAGRLAMVVATLLSAACATPPVHYYGLGPGLPAAAPSAPLGGPSVVVGPVVVPAAVDRFQIVRVLDGTRIDVADDQRWIAPLKTEIARRVASEITRLRGFERSVPWTQSTQVEPELRLPIDVIRLEAEGFSQVTLEAVWTLRKAGKDVLSRRFAASEAVVRPDYAALAAAHGRLVDALARDIAAALPAR